jgi:hypothetical protein
VVAVVLFSYSRIDLLFGLTHQIACSKLLVPHLSQASWAWARIECSIAATIDQLRRITSFVRAITVVNQIAVKSTNTAVSLIQRD